MINCNPLINCTRQSVGGGGGGVTHRPTASRSISSGRGLSSCLATACHAVLGLAVDARGWGGPSHERREPPERPDPLRGRGRRSHGHAVGELTRSV